MLLAKTVNAVGKSRLGDVADKTVTPRIRNCDYRAQPVYINEIFLQISSGRERHKQVAAASFGIQSAQQCIDLAILTSILINLSVLNGIILWISEFWSHRTQILKDAS